MKMRLFTALTAALACLSAAHADIVVRDDSGQDVRLKAPARRIVTLAPHSAESLYAAGAGTYLVGTVDYSDYPPEAKKVARVGGYSRLDLEAIAALKPDLVIAWQSGNAAVQIDKLRALGLTVFITQPNLMADVAVQLEQLGQLAGTQAVADAAAASFRQRMEKLRAANASKPKVRVFYQIWKSPLMTVGGQQIITDAIRLCGGDNVFGQMTKMAPTVSVEAVLEADPEAIIATGMGDARPEWLHDWDKWTRMTAVKRNNLFHINPDIMQRHTPRILEGAEKLCAHLDVARSHRPK
ncbi:cobalamin-binding protein [Quatrionicoccus australiensis]|uniref:cobalamin-binding protein n=1 Tax=Quatrionicoccus australiensis TaxID=138118 RepID=UPI001CF9A886|nr:cobalamin-binding protein [Quatrionicoccus australiensis]